MKEPPLISELRNAAIRVSALLLKIAADCEVLLNRSRLQYP